MPIYCDLNSEFLANQNETRPTAEDLKDIKQNLERLFMTGKGEVPFNREYGTSLKSLLFDTNVDTESIKMFLYMDIQQFEPRVTISPQSLDIKKVDNNTFQVTCNFTVPSLNYTAASAQAVVSNG